MESFLRLLRHTKNCFPDDDFETVAIYLTVAAASAGHALRDSALLAKLAGGPLPDDQHRPTSRRAIATATGLPRETVRRKLKELIDAGRLIEVKGRVRIPHDTLGRGHNRQFAALLIAELAAGARRVEQFSKFDRARVTPSD